MNILIVDDEQEIVVILTEWLSEKGHRVTGITGGAHVASWVKKQSVDLVLLDIKLPDANGLALISDIVTAGAKVIVISGLPRESWIATALEKGASGCLPKPVVLAALDAMMQTL